MTVERLRVWLEPGYDGGRFGAWMLDLPGCFTWRPDREATLAEAVPRAVEFVRWLADHGEPAPFDVTGREAIEVVEEVAPTWDGDYERNATFAADHDTVSADELDAAIRVLGHARADLDDLLRRLGGAATGISDGRPDRPVEEVLRHVGGAEIWLASRLDGSLRYAGPTPDDGLDVYLAATRAWTIEQIRLLHGRDPGLERTDGKGETWTLRKVVRRLVYHSLDHVDELALRSTRS